MSFLDNYHVLAAYIGLRSSDTLASCQAYTNFTPAPDLDPHTIGKLLLNGWSAEYALRITPVVNDEQYLQSSLHWTFPQAYYSVLFSARAFLNVQGHNVSNEDLIRRKIGFCVSRGYYPPSVGFYAFGLPSKYVIHRLPSTVPLLTDFLKVTRDKRVKRHTESLQMNPRTAIRDSKTGEILHKFSIEQYREVCKQVGFTTYFDLLCRLRISSTDRDIERFVDGTIDVRAFHMTLVNIVAYINAIHESYIVKALGFDAYRDIVRQLPSYLQESFVRERMYSLTPYASQLV